MWMHLAGHWWADSGAWRQSGSICCQSRFFVTDIPDQMWLRLTYMMVVVTKVYQTDREHILSISTSELLTILLVPVGSEAGHKMERLQPRNKHQLKD